MALDSLAPPGWKPAAPDLAEEPDLQPVLVEPDFRAKYAGIEESFILKCKILVNRPGGVVEVPLWLNTGLEDMPDLPIVESVNVEWGPGVMGKISISMKTDYATGKWFLDNELSRFRNALVVQAGYPKANVWTPVFYGLTDIPQPSHDPLGYQITLSATIIGHRLRRMKYNIGKFIKGKLTRRDVVKEFLKSQQYDVIFHLDPTTGREEENAWMNTLVESKNLGSGRFWPGDLSIEGFIDWVCLQAGMRCVMWPHPDSGDIYAFSFVNRSTIMSQEVNRELRLYSGIDTARGIYPLTNFNSTSPQVFMDALVMGIQASDIDPISKEEKKFVTKEWVIKAPALEAESEGVRYGADATDPLSMVLDPKEIISDYPDETELEAMAREAVVASHQESAMATDSGHQLLWDPGIEDAPAGVILASPAGRDKDEEGLMQSLYEEGLMVDGGLQAQLQTVGMPDAHPEMKVMVRRVGDRFDGVYNVRKVNHEFTTIWNTTLDSVKSEFSKGSGLLQTNRPILPQKEVEKLYPAYPAELPAEEADG